MSTLIMRRAVGKGEAKVILTYDYVAASPATLPQRKSARKGASLRRRFLC
jgi:hypothetical protein